MIPKKLGPLEKSMKDQADRKPRYQQKVDNSKDKIKEYEVEWQSIQESVNLVTDEMTKIQQEQATINNDLKQKKNVFRSKQVGDASSNNKLIIMKK